LFLTGVKLQNIRIPNSRRCLAQNIDL